MSHVTEGPRVQSTPPDFSISLRGQAYPLSCRRSLTADEPAPINNPSMTQLYNRIIGLLAFLRQHPDGFQSVSEIVRAFGNEVALLDSMADQWRDFLMAVRKANIHAVLNGQVPTRQRQRAIDLVLETMGHGVSVMVDDQGVLNSELVEQPPLHVFQTLQQALRDMVVRFIVAMHHDLERLSELRVVGLLGWTGKTTCSFHYYEHTLTELVDEKQTTETAVAFQQDGQRYAGTEVTTELTGRHIHSVTRCEELLIDAKAEPASDPKLVIPGKIRSCLRKCPVWLRPELEVVEGEKIREDRIEVFRTEQEWQTRWSQQRIRPVFDPALTLFGQFVLAGWDEKIHEKEIRGRIRRSTEQLSEPSPNPAEANSSLPFTALLAWAAAAAFGMMIVLSAAGRLAVLSVVFPLCSVPSTYQWLIHSGWAKRQGFSDVELILPIMVMYTLVLSAGFGLGGVAIGTAKYFGGAALFLCISAALATYVKLLCRDNRTGGVR